MTKLEKNFVKMELVGAEIYTQLNIYLYVYL